MTITKTLDRVRVKDASEGTIRAVFATLGVVDRDGDVTRAGAFNDGAPVIISSYNHGSWEGALPVGKGTISVVGDEAILDGQFLMDTSHGRDAFETVKALGDLQEWSYSLEDVESEKGTLDGRPVNYLNRIKVREVSPVIRGAGVNTRVIAAKQHATKTLASTTRGRLAGAAAERWGTDNNWVYVTDYDPDENVAYVTIYDGDDTRTIYQVGYTLTETGIELDEESTEVEQVVVYSPKGNTFTGRKDLALRAVNDLVATGVERIGLRAPQGKSTSEQREALDTLSEALQPLEDALSTIRTEDEATKEFLSLVALKHGVHQ